MTVPLVVTGLGIRPYPDDVKYHNELSPLIEFKPDDKSSYKEHKESIAKYLKCKCFSYLS